MASITNTKGLKEKFKADYKDFMYFTGDDLVDTEEVTMLSIVQIDEGKPEMARKILSDWQAALREQRFKK